MEHRHLNPGYEDTVEAVEDVLERGSVEDWRDLAARVREDPGGAAARALRTVLEHRTMYGTTVIWRRFLDRVEARGRTGRRSPGPASKRKVKA
ncbi:hypothetical protein [Limnochorda pilosa]|uniref:Uncharacterized protein n=1 Tax=Limnochorda pilosa TaxID=1555112 RepID=A0A0K2SQ63_LIMPI|nr:hypothetical protein [Limnochorda pilosa]BAS29260.1 hypothetical protein LIP_3448 [Limnochorda pilosa]